jgi:hypothetical protein
MMRLVAGIKAGTLRGEIGPGYLAIYGYEITLTVATDGSRAGNPKNNNCSCCWVPCERIFAYRQRFTCIFLLRYCRNVRLTWVLFYSSDTKKFVEFEWLVLRPMGS